MQAALPTAVPCAPAGARHAVPTGPRTRPSRLAATKQPDRGFFAEADPKGEGSLLCQRHRAFTCPRQRRRSTAACPPAAAAARPPPPTPPLLQPRCCL